ncbi:MAG: DUF5663 domain-containing protein [Candidatus Pacebacteria bacterium]|nr:DUF5663 domain-containing protein [Candidatus Paceibacterota bacterium]
MKKEIITKGIIDLLGLAQLPEDRKKKLVDQMSEVVQMRIARRVDQVLPEDAKLRFAQLLNSGADEATVNAFLVTNVPSFDSIATEEILKFKEEMATNAEEVKAALKE